MFMTKKSWLLVVFAVALAVVYIHFFTDWFKPTVIQISHIERPMPFRGRPGANIPIITFGFDRAYRFSDIKVVPFAGWQTNQSILPLWHLTANSKSAPMKFFRYGQNIRDMKPAVAHARPEPLQSNVIYRLLVQVGSVTAHHDFQLGHKPAVLSTN